MLNPLSGFCLHYCEAYNEIKSVAQIPLLTGFKTICWLIEFYFADNFDTEWSIPALSSFIVTVQMLTL